MILNNLKIGTAAFLWLLGSSVVSAQQLTSHQEIKLNDLAAFKNPGNSWTIVGDVAANPNMDNELKLSKGNGILVNNIGKKVKGADLFTNELHGNIILELDYMMAKGSNSGIYLQGNYEIQLADSWGIANPLSSDNGGIYERWDDTKPEGNKGFEGQAPRQNASKAPGLWQHLKVAFQAPQFDAAGKKIANARILSLILNGVLIQENVELSGPTRGAAGPEQALSALRLQGDHGAVAFKNIKISKLPDDQLNGGQRGREEADPIYIDATANTMIRSFVELPDIKVVHAISVGSPLKVHYSYDLDNGLLLFGWHGEFVDATPMWHERGNGTSRPRGAVTRFTNKLIPQLAVLSNGQAPWPTDTAGTGFRSKGYVMDNEDRPEFKYNVHDAQVSDVITVANNGQGFSRRINISKPVSNLYVLLANASNIVEMGKGLYLIDDQSYYIQLEEKAAKPMIRTVEGRKELMILLGDKLSYQILF